jgi:hypothetical protein
MSDHEKLVIPAGVRFQNQSDGLVIEHAGDIEIRGTPGGDLAGVVSSAGSVTLTGDVVVGSVNAALDLNVNGNVKADLLQATAVNVIGGRLYAKALKGLESVNLGAARVEIDIVLAPEVVIGPKAQGRVAVIESKNDMAPNALKGGFSLADFAEFTGKDPQQFLRERGLGDEVMAEKSAETDEAEDEPEPEPEPGPEADPDPDPEPVSEHRASDDPESIDPSSGGAAEESDDSVSVPEPSVPEDPEPASAEDEPNKTNEADAVHGKLMENVDRIVSCYGEGEQPPAVLQLRSLIDQQEYQVVRDEITNLWNNLLKFHQKKGMRIQHQVTTTFNTINSIVRKMESA